MTFNSLNAFINNVFFLVGVFIIVYLVIKFTFETIAGKKESKLKQIHEEKLNYINSILKEHNVRILPKDRADIENASLQSLDNYKCAGEISLLDSGLTNGDEVYRISLKNKGISDAIIDINIDEKITNVKATLVKPDFIRAEFENIKSLEKNGLKHPYIQNNKVLFARGVSLAKKNYSISHATRNGNKVKMKINKGDLLIPAININNEFVSYQVVDKSENRCMRIGTSINGAFFPIGSFNNLKKVILCEDYLTAATLNKCTGLTSVICFDVQNILEVAKAFLSKYPQIQLIFATSRDMLTKNKSRIKRGLYYSNLFSMPFIFPNFPEGEKYDHFKNWNELNRYISDNEIDRQVQAQVNFFIKTGKKNAIQIVCDRYEVEY